MSRYLSTSRVAIFMLMLTCQTIAVGQGALIDKIIANVGGQYVMLSELEEQYQYVATKNTNLPEDARCVILDNILTEKLLIYQAKVDSIDITNDEVQSQLDSRVERILSLMNNDVGQFIDYYGMTPTEMKEFMRDDIRDQLLSERIRNQIIAEAKVTPSEVKSFFESIPSDSLPYFNAEVEYREIVVKPEVSAEEKAKSYQEISNLRERLLNGEDFSKLAELHSDDPGSAKQGGDLGWQKRGTFVPEFEAAAYSLSPGEYSEIIETPFGYHIIQLLERRGNLIRVKHILKRPKLTEAEYTQTTAMLDSVKLLIEQDSVTFSASVKKYGYDKEQSYNNDGRVTNQKTGNTFFEIAELDYNIYFALDTLEVGEISAPIEFFETDGTRLYRLVQLESRSEPHKAGLSTDYSKIHDAALEAKRSDIIVNWVIDQRDNTFIELSKEYMSCAGLDKWQIAK